MFEKFLKFFTFPFLHIPPELFPAKIQFFYGQSNIITD